MSTASFPPESPCPFLMSPSHSLHLAISPPTVPWLYFSSNSPWKIPSHFLKLVSSNLTLPWNSQPIFTGAFCKFPLWHLTTTQCHPYPSALTLLHCLYSPLWSVVISLLQFTVQFTAESPIRDWLWPPMQRHHGPLFFLLDPAALSTHRCF